MYIETLDSSAKQNNTPGLITMQDDVIEIKGTLYSTKVTTFNEYVAFLTLVKQDEIISQQWDTFRGRFDKTARVPNQDQNLDIPARTLEVGKGYTCPTTHQCDFGESSAPNLEVASKKGKEKLEHFEVKLEEEKEYHD
ncbi:hypothetical protein Tco_0929410 [Tanacetum coccineum]